MSVALARIDGIWCEAVANFSDKSLTTAEDAFAFR